MGEEMDMKYIQMATKTKDQTTQQEGRRTHFFFPLLVPLPALAPALKVPFLPGTNSTPLIDSRSGIGRLEGPSTGADGRFGLRRCLTPAEMMSSRHVGDEDIFVKGLDGTVESARGGVFRPN